MSGGRAYDADWLEFDDARRFYVGSDGMRHIPAGMNARCGVGPLATVLRPEEEIEFRCSICWPPRTANNHLPCGHLESDLTSGEHSTFCAVCAVAPRVANQDRGD